MQRKKCFSPVARILFVEISPVAVLLLKGKLICLGSVAGILFVESSLMNLTTSNRSKGLGPVAGILFVESLPNCALITGCKKYFSPVAGILFVERRNPPASSHQFNERQVWVPLPGFYLLKGWEVGRYAWKLEKFQSRCRDSIC